MPRAAARAGGLSALLLFAALVVASNVVTENGNPCVSAYRSLRGDLATGGEVPAAERAGHAARCRDAAKPVMLAAYLVAIAGGVTGLVAVGCYVAAARPKAE